MEERKSQNPIAWIGGTLFALLALTELVEILFGIFVGRSWYYGTLRSDWYTCMFGFAGFLTAAIAVFFPQRRRLALIAFPLLAVKELLCFFLCLDYLDSDYVSISNVVGIVASGSLFLCYILLSVLSVVSQQKSNSVNNLRNFWFVPVLPIALGALVSVFWGLIDGGFWDLDFFIYCLRYIEEVSPMLILGTLLAGAYLAYPDGFPKKSQKKTTVQYADGTAAEVSGEMYYSLAKHVLLLIFTCGVWMYIWIYRMTGYLNRVKDEPEQKPTTELLLCMFVPLYFIFWTYKNAQKIDKLAKEKGVQSDISTLCLILAIFVGIVPPIIMQDKVNAIITSKGTPTPAAPQSPAASAPVDVPAELKKYKELLDTGVITQEEFEQKKRELLK